MKRFLLLAVLVIATACGGGSDGATATLTVSPAPVATVIVALSTSTVIAGMPTTATATLRDDRGNTLSNRAVTWSSSAPTVATVDVAGTVTTLIPGATTVTATSEGKSGVASLVVIPPPVATVAVALSQSVIAPGRTTTASAVLRDANGIALADRPITWNSSATGVATVDANGGIVALTPGSAIISAVSEGKSGSATLTVQLPPVATITVVGASSIAPGATATEGCVGRPAERTGHWLVDERSLNCAGQRQWRRDRRRAGLCRDHCDE